MRGRWTSWDGTQIAYVVSEGTTLQLYLQRLDEFDARRVPQSDGANNPFFSPDGQWVGFFAHDGLYKVSTTGGAPVWIADGPAVGAGAQWTADDTIWYSDVNSLFRVSADGSNAELLFQTPEDIAAIVAPHVLPGGNRVLLGVMASAGQQAVASLSLDTRELVPVPELERTVWTRYLPTGHLIYNRGTDLWAGAFDPVSLRFVGPAATVLEGVEFLTNTGASLADLSDRGTLVYAPRGPTNRLVWVDRQGRIDPLPVEPGRYRFPRLAPGGDRIVTAATPLGALAELRLVDLERGGVTGLTAGEYPVWSPDGLTVTATLIEGFRLSQVPVGRPSNITHLEEAGINIPGDWSADGRLHVFYKIDSETNRDIWIVSRDGDAEPFLVTPANERTPYFSPDGRWIVYVSDESGRDEVYVQGYPDADRRWTISTDGGREPIWSADGTEIFYRNGQQVLVVDVTHDDTFEANSPRVLFEARFGSHTSGLPNYDVSRDGQRFLMLTDSSPAELRVIENFGEMVAERLSSP